MSRLTKLDRNVYHPTPTGAQFLEPDDGSNAARLLQVIGKYEDTEEQLGKNYEKLLLAKKNGFISMTIKGGLGDEWKANEVVVDYDFFEQDFCLRSINNGGGLGHTRFWLKDYGKTWLNKEESEK